MSDIPPPYKTQKPEPFKMAFWKWCVLTAVLQGVLAMIIVAVLNYFQLI